jgi:hypothetical protein
LADQTTIKFTRGKYTNQISSGEGNELGNPGDFRILLDPTQCITMAERPTSKPKECADIDVAKASCEIFEAVLTLDPQEWKDVKDDAKKADEKTEPEGVDWGELHVEVAWKKEVLVKFRNLLKFPKIFKF